MTKWVSSTALDGAPALVQQLGGDWRDLFARAGLPEDAFEDRSNQVKVSALARFLFLATAELECECFGILLAQYQEFSLFGPLMLLFGSAQTIGELIDDMAKYFSLFTQGAVVGLVKSSGGTELSYDLATGTGLAYRQIVELGFAFLIKEIRRHIPNWEPEYVTLRHAPPATRLLHGKFLGPTIYYNADRNAIFFTAKDLSKPTQEGNALLHGELAVSFNALRETAAGTITATVEGIVRAFMPQATIDLTRAASLLRMSRRTLQRRLEQDGTSLAQIIDAVRADLALSYLEESRLKITDISEILQFSQTSAFSRAVVRWYGMTPRAIRAGQHRTSELSRSQ